MPGRISAKAENGRKRPSVVSFPGTKMTPAEHSVSAASFDFRAGHPGGRRTPIIAIFSVLKSLQKTPLLFILKMLAPIITADRVGTPPAGILVEALGRFPRCRVGIGDIEIAKGVLPCRNSSFVRRVIGRINPLGICPAAGRLAALALAAGVLTGVGPAQAAPLLTWNPRQRERSGARRPTGATWHSRPATRSSFREPRILPRGNNGNRGHSDRRHHLPSRRRRVCVERKRDPSGGQHRQSYHLWYSL